MFPRFFLIAALLTASACLLLAQQDVTIDTNAILRDLDALEKKGNAAATSKRKSALDELRAAANSPSAAANLYLQAVEATQFEGRKNDSGAFSDWKKDQMENIRGKEWQLALQLHIKYILISIESKDAKPDVGAEASIAYVKELVAADSVFQKQANTSKNQRDLFEKPVSDSVFTKWLRLEPMLPKGPPDTSGNHEGDLQNWEMSPGDISGIFNKNIRSGLRATKDPTLLNTWDLEMKIEADRVTTGRLQHQADQFNFIRKPQLLFSKAKDYAVLGQPNRAIQEMLAVAKAYPQHPNFPEWSAAIREMIGAQTNPDRP